MLIRPGLGISLDDIDNFRVRLRAVRNARKAGVSWSRIEIELDWLDNLDRQTRRLSPKGNPRDVAHENKTTCR